uniref:phenylalanine--tRNA ligase n=1 Tax=Pterocladia lucida TaxID=31408 RepID=A0A6M3WW60_PTELU|nr:syfB [Pterocladia lucida]
MKFSWKSLNYLIDLKDITLEDLANQLILAGFEVENISYISEINDQILDIDITANRQDISSVVGLAKEISCILNKPIDIKPKISNKTLSTKQNQKYLSEICGESASIMDIAIQNITDIHITKSPQWLINYLISYDIKPSNIIDDIINYINIKWGQDIEILDLEKITEEPFNIQYLTLKKDINKKNRNKLTTKTKYEAIQYYNQTISINGIYTETDCKYKATNSSLTILSTICNPKYIKDRITENTQKAEKHLKHISRDDFISGYQEAVELISKFTNSTANTKYSYHRIQTNNVININKNLIYNILGPLNKETQTYLSIRKIIDILKKLKFQPIYYNNNFQVIIPSYRYHDIQRPIDVIEEIGRIYGFSKFKDQLPIMNKKGYIKNSTKQIYKIRETLRDLGLHEVINYSLNEKKHSSQVALYNPLLKEQAYLRNNLINNLINIKDNNIKQKNICFEGFEIGKVFYKQENNVFIEKKNIAGIIGNPNFARRSWSNQIQELTWFQAKGNIEKLFRGIQANVGWKSNNSKEYKTLDSNTINIYKNQRCALLYNKLTQEEIGVFGETKSIINTKLNSDHKIYIFELDLNALLRTIKYTNPIIHRIREYSLYPSITRDTSIKLKKEKNIDCIKEIILQNNYKLIESIEIFNEYEKITNKKEKYISLRITYRALSRTLEEKDIKEIDNQINNLIKIHTQE